MADTDRVTPKIAQKDAQKDMDRWLGDGGMPIIGLVGGAFTTYGVDGEELGWAGGTFTPTDLACNPHGITQAGIHSLLLDAAMNFAINAALPRKARTRGTLEMKTECMRPARLGETFVLRGEVVRMAKQVAYGEASLRDVDGALVSRATGTFLLHRPSPNPPPDLYRVPPPGPGVCLICCGPAEASAVCFACRLVGRRLALPLVSVSPARLCPLPGPLYTVLMGYKESPVPEARARFSPMVCQLFDVFFATHSACVDGDDPVDQVLAVPSSARPSGPPLAGVPGLADVVQSRLGARFRGDLLCRGPGTLGHMRPQRGRVCRPGGPALRGAGAAPAAARRHLRQWCPGPERSCRPTSGRRRVRADRGRGPCTQTRPGAGARRLPPPSGHCAFCALRGSGLSLLR